MAELPPTYLVVGDLDIFCAEDLAYAAALSAAGVDTEVHVHRGSPHGFEFHAPDSGVDRRAMTDRIRALTSF